MAKKKKINVPKIDGRTPEQNAKIRIAVRQVWSWSYQRKLVIERCTGFDGFPFCELCGERCPKVFVDHIKNVGDVDEGFLDRMFVPSKYLQGLCKPCHGKKTNEERKKKRPAKIKRAKK